MIMMMMMMMMMADSSLAKISGKISVLGGGGTPSGGCRGLPWICRLWSSLEFICSLYLLSHATEAELS